MFGFDALHAHVCRELRARDNDSLVFVETQQAEKLLGRLDISYDKGNVVEVFDHGIWYGLVELDRLQTTNAFLYNPSQLAIQQDAMAPKPRIPVRFAIGDVVEITSKVRLRFAGKRAVIISVEESRYSHTLDKYTVRVDDFEQSEVFWDFELKKLSEGETGTKAKTP